MRVDGCSISVADVTTVMSIAPMGGTTQSGPSDAAARSGLTGASLQRGFKQLVGPIGGDSAEDKKKRTRVAEKVAQPRSSSAQSAPSSRW
jgi:hypothetical protein